MNTQCRHTEIAGEKYVVKDAEEGRMWKGSHGWVGEMWIPGFATQVLVFKVSESGTVRDRFLFFERTDEIKTARNVDVLNVCST
jgi:hypothetical protein